jgi:hypothetical protein
MPTKKLRYVYEPLQTLPGVFTAMHAQRNEHVCRSKSANLHALNPHGFQTGSKHLNGDFETESLWRELPLKVYDDVMVRTVEHIPRRPLPVDRILIR